MPLHIDVRLNERTVRRLHISRMTSNGMHPDAVNEYAVVVSNKPTVRVGDSVLRRWKESPEPWEWDASEIRFLHRYGDDDLTCLMKAIEAVKRMD